MYIYIYDIYIAQNAPRATHARRPGTLAPHPEAVVRPCGYEALLARVKHHRLHRLLVALQNPQLSALNSVKDLDRVIVRRKRNDRPRLVELDLVGAVRARIDLHPLEYHPHVPQAHASVGVGGGDGVSAEVEGHVVDGVEVPVEGLDAEPRAGVPERDRLVARAGAEVVAEGLEHHRVDAVNVPPEGLPALALPDIPQLGRVVHRTRRKIVSAVVVRAPPHRLGVVRERGDALGLREVPHLDRAVPRRRGQRRRLGVEVDARHPALVPLPRHDELPVGYRPHLPSRVVRRRRQDALLGVHGKARDGRNVALEALLQVVSLGPLGVEGHGEVGVLPVLEGDEGGVRGGLRHRGPHRPAPPRLPQPEARLARVHAHVALGRVVVVVVVAREGGARGDRRLLQLLLERLDLDRHLVRLHPRNRLLLHGHLVLLLKPL
mmetsp:Transcript_8340/g.20426  ORF Transcript_8340/g.20426 Transcript_8340/m.20426 type:complete len:434 (-) Transcript_8340:294-1595(-)